MFRVLVMSDSHGRNENVRKAIEKAGKIDLMFHLGDVGADFREVENMAGVPTYLIAGNNDIYSELKRQRIIKVGGHKILMVHGHRQNVHFGVNTLYYMALENDCDIAMYGHTHYPYLDEDRNVTILNPGSISLPRQEGRQKTFAIMEVDDNDKVTFTFDHI